MSKVGRRVMGKYKNTFAVADPLSDDEDIHNNVNNGAENKYQAKKWFEEYSTDIRSTSEIKFSELEALRKEAKSLLDEAIALNKSKPPKTISESDFQWMKTVMAKGTKSDKIAAYVVIIQDSPLYNLHFLNNIINLVKVGKKEWILAAETLQELFLKDLLPPNRKLSLFSQQPLSELSKVCSGMDGKRKKLLIYWFFENQLKLAYRDFVVALNQVAHDSVDANKEKAISIMAKLLEDNPEQESALLSNVVNKLGDPSHKVGSKVIYTLTKLLQVHPNMREVVLDEVEKLLFRPNISKRAQYYSICFLTQFCLTNDNAKLAKKLIYVYLSIFKACIKTSEIDSRLMSALLTGVNRAYPFAKDDTQIVQEQINTIYKVVHFGKPIVAIQALSLLYLMTGGTGSDRFFMALYKKVSDTRLYNSTHHAMFLSLIFKALKKDKSNKRVVSFVKRLLQVSSYLPAPIVCGLLFIISEVIAKKRKSILLLEHKAQEKSTSRMCYVSDDEDDEYEHYDDVRLESETEGEEPTETKSTSDSRSEFFAPKEESLPLDSKSAPLGVWRNPRVAPDERNEVTKYDPYHRNPLYAGGEKSVLVELHKLTSHYHPTVSLFASNILKGERIRYSGDPIQDFALIRFLDKFSFKNPKTLKTPTEEKETFAKFGKRKLYSHLIVTRLKAKKDDYLKQNEENVPADEKFIFSYLKDRASKVRQKTDEDESDVESVASDEFESMIHKMMGTKDEEDVDFLSEAGQLPTKEKGKHKKRKLEPEEEEEEEIEEEEEEEMSDGGSAAEDFDGNEIDSGLSDDIMEGSELDESEIPPSLMHLNKSKKCKKVSSERMDTFSKGKLFASAEEFSELLEQNDYRAGGSHAVSNKDRAGIKQLRWEAKRMKQSR